MAEDQPYENVSEGLPWRFFGPPDRSGRIKCLAIDPENDQIVYAGSANGGVWKTINGGEFWVPTMEREASLAIGALGIAPSNPNILYAATGEGVSCFPFTYPGVGVFRTDDGGRVWKAPEGRMGSRRCTRVLVHPNNPDIVYVAGNVGLHRSCDGGNTWKTVFRGFVSDAELKENDPDTLYIGAWRRGIYRSDDAGCNWTLLQNGVPAGGPAGWIKLTIGSKGEHGTDLLIAKMGHNSGSLFRSTNGGTSWLMIPRKGQYEPSAYAGWTSLVKVSPHDGNVVFAGGQALVRSTDGNSFQPSNTKFQDQQALVFSHQDRNLCYLASDGGVSRSTNEGLNWTLGNMGLATTQFYSMGVAQTEPFVIGGSCQDIGMIENRKEQEWISTASSEGGFFIVDPGNSDFLYSRPEQAFLRIRVGAADWRDLFFHDDLQFTHPGISHLAVSPDNSHRLLAAMGDKLFLSTDQGKKWCMVTEFTVGAVTRVAFSPSSASVCYAATEKGFVYRNDVAGRASGWNMAHPQKLGPTRAPIRALAVGWQEPDVVAVAGGCLSEEIFISRNGGQTWDNADGDSPKGMRPAKMSVHALLFDLHDSNILYAGTDCGVFRTCDGGRNWKAFDRGLPRTTVMDLALHRRTNRLFAATFGRGIYVRLL